METVSITIGISGTHDGQSYSTRASYTANVRGVTKFSRDLTDTFETVLSAPAAISFAIMENTGTDDAFVFIGRISTVIPAGKTIVINGATGEDNAGITMYPGATIEAKSRTSAGTRINCLVGF